MKTMKLALLATAALAAVSVSARADSVADLTAQMEALNARIAQLEAAPAAPVGYSLISMSEVDAITFAGQSSSDRKMIDSSNRISILPTADVPAAASIDWDMEVRANITYYSYEDSDDGDIDLSARARLAAHGSTDTSVGKVGVKIRLQSSFDYSTALTSLSTSDGSVEGWSSGSNFAVMNVGYGYWNMTENLTLIGGFTGSLSGIGFGQDGVSFGNANGPGSLHGDQEQFQLAYASGPISFAVAVEDGNENDGSGGADTFDTDLAFAGEVKYSGDTISGEISVGYGPADSPADDKWVAGVGIGFALGDMANLSAAAQMWHGHTGDEGWNASLLATVDVTDAAYLEASVGYAESDYTAASTVVNVGAYWAPVDQLTIGVQADHKFGDDIYSSTSASLITWFKF